MEKQDRRQALLWWGVCFLLVMLFVGTDLFPEFNPDDYTVLGDLQSSAKDMIFLHGRPVVALMFYLLALFCVPYNTYYIVFFTMGVLALTLGVWRLQAFLVPAESTVRQQVYAVLTAFLLVVNPFCIEYFLYGNGGSYAFAAYFALEAFLAGQKFFDTKEKKQLVVCEILLFVSVFTYQAGPGLFVVLSLPMILKRTRDARSFLTQNLWVMGMYGVPAILSWLYTVVLVHSARFQDSAGLFERIRIAAAGIQALFNILPCKVCHICVFGVFCLLAVRIVGQGKQVPWRLFGLVYLCAGTAVAGMAPAVAMAATSYRSTYPVASILGVLVWYWLQLAQEQGAPAPKWQRGGVTALAALLLVVQYGKFQSIILTRYTTNRVDRFMIEAIGQRIAEYERDHEPVTTVSVYYDAGLTEMYDPDEGWIGDFNARSFARTWSIFPSLELYTGRAFARGEQDPALAEHFAQQDWDAFSQEQMVFDGDTLHLCIY